MFFVCFGLFDFVSTIIVSNATGSYQGEWSLIPRIVLNSGGIWAFAILKLLIVGIAAVYFYGLSKENQFSIIAQGVFVGGILCGIYVSLSNIYGALTGSTFWLFGINAAIVGITIAIIIIIGAVIFQYNPGKEGRSPC